MLILDKTGALDRIVARSLPEPERLPDVFRMLSIGATPATFGLSFDPYVGLAELVAPMELASVNGAAA